MTYGSECWEVIKSDTQNLQANDRECWDELEARSITWTPGETPTWHQWQYFSQTETTRMVCLRGKRTRGGPRKDRQTRPTLGRTRRSARWQKTWQTIEVGGTVWQKSVRYYKDEVHRWEVRDFLNLPVQCYWHSLVPKTYRLNNVAILSINQPLIMCIRHSYRMP